MTRKPQRTQHLRRAAGISIGIATHMLFAVTVWYLYWFLKNVPGTASSRPLLADSLLALQFAVPHSILLHPAARHRLGRIVPSAFYGLFFCCVTCVSLLGTIFFWQASSVVVWQTEGAANTALQVLFHVAWGALFYSLAISGLGYQTGLTPWLAWVRRRNLPRRTFEEKGWYKSFRHPIYLSFLGLIWLTPRMTLDHLVLSCLWTAYIFVGSWLKDRRLEFYAGSVYREYESRVPGYPFLKRGPLGLRRF